MDDISERHHKRKKLIFFIRENTKFADSLVLWPEPMLRSDFIRSSRYAAVTRVDAFYLMM